MPVGSSTGSMQVLDSRNPVLPDPGVVRVLDAVFLANLPHLWSDKGVPGRRHAGEQVMLDLKVESTSEAATNESTIRAGRLDLRLVPADRFALFAGVLDRITVGVHKVV